MVYLIQHWQGHLVNTLQGAEVESKNRPALHIFDGVVSYIHYEGLMAAGANADDKEDLLILYYYEEMRWEHLYLGETRRAINCHSSYRFFTCFPSIDCLEFSNTFYTVDMIWSDLSGGIF